MILDQEKFHIGLTHCSNAKSNGTLQNPQNMMHLARKERIYSLCTCLAEKKNGLNAYHQVKVN